MDTKQLAHLNDLQSLPADELILALTGEGTDLVHKAGLLAEELTESSQQPEIDAQEIQELAGFIRDEIQRYHQVLNAALVNVAARRAEDSTGEIFVIHPEDNVGIFLGKTLPSGEMVETSGHMGGMVIFTNGELSHRQYVTLFALTAGEPLRLFGAAFETTSADMPAGTPLSP